ncbi:MULTISPECIES: lytic murein transglycosylase [unclassified Shinella]|jgi:membrane-bound lytic murein transglycosylase B|uniref:lytic murein transglycosylase n=1 Tax=unclassified Shinella TaxID=2643062 RepID=UPI00067FDDE1|nr:MULTISPECIES: lytic murein transglycosylase [unclassified Shinella]MCO5057529.1 lytic murein transglycosylase [Rhizobiaceae bacterium]KNY17344.1 lytic transglycosylase [Shinella sp. SUS2]KOC72436.1 lytic transglycosylase [Shinella sp. GWS1]MCO5150692.1 lytic murein transglycosylase [Shinella sp.]MDC7263297.1 lytic murein transglycosylase [Shinella sp. HY16]
MTQNLKTVLRRSALTLLLSAGLFAQATAARADARFQKWIADFYATASEAGISKSTYQKAFSGVKTPDPAVLEKAAYQPEFKHKIWDYLDSRVNPYTVRIGQEMAAKHGRTLAALERHFGVDRNILLAIWSMESNYGAVLEKDDRLHYVPRALATLAYADKKRAKFARTQLIAALKIIQRGDIAASDMTGSWAGAMGHTQFIPTSYLIYAVDADGNGHRDIWNSVPDALATAANLLAKNGWQAGKTWGYEIIVPTGGSKYSGQTKTLAQWAKLGFTRPNGSGFKNGADRAELKLPANGGPGFLMTKNFFVIKRYNASDSYAMGVGMLADQLAGYSGVKQRWPRPEGTLDITEKFELQTRLKELGYYDGEVDGNFGSGSKAAIQAFQNRMGLSADGEPSLQVLKALRR